MVPYPVNAPGWPAGIPATATVGFWGFCVSGPAKIGVLVRLKASALNCRFNPSLTTNCLPTPIASCGAYGARMAPDLCKIVRGCHDRVGMAAKQLGVSLYSHSLNVWCAGRRLLLFCGQLKVSPWIFARLMGVPESAVRIHSVFQLLISAPRKPEALLPISPPFPTGRPQTPAKDRSNVRSFPPSTY